MTGRCELGPHVLDGPFHFGGDALELDLEFGLVWLQTLCRSNGAKREVEAGALSGVPTEVDVAPAGSPAPLTRFGSAI